MSLSSQARKGVRYEWPSCQKNSNDPLGQRQKGAPNNCDDADPTDDSDPGDTGAPQDNGWEMTEGLIHNGFDSEFLSDWNVAGTWNSGDGNPTSTDYWSMNGTYQGSANHLRTI